MDDHGDRVPGNHKFNRLDSILFRCGDLFRFHASGCIGNIHRSIDQGGDSGSGSTPGDRKADLGILRLIFLSPGQGQVDNRVRSLVLNGQVGLRSRGVCFWSAAGASTHQQGQQKE